MRAGASGARPVADDEDLRRDLQLMGAPPDVLAAIAAREAAPSGLWAENVSAFLAFQLVATQWRTAPAGGGFVLLGLDYTAARIGLRAAGVRVTPELWAGVLVAEAAARAALNGRG